MDGGLANGVTTMTRWRTWTCRRCRRSTARCRRRRRVRLRRRPVVAARAAARARRARPARRGFWPRSARRRRLRRPARRTGTRTRCRCRSSRGMRAGPRWSCGRAASGRSGSLGHRAGLRARLRHALGLLGPGAAPAAGSDRRRDREEGAPGVGGGSRPARLQGPSALGRGRSRDGGVVGRHGAPGAPGGRSAAVVAGLPATVRGAAGGHRLPGGDEERGRGDDAGAVRRVPAAAGAGEPGAGAPVVHGSRSGGDGGRKHGACHPAQADAVPRGLRAAAHEPAWTSRRVFEDLFPSRQRGMAVAQLRLQRQGQAVGFHVEPATGVFGPGSALDFFAGQTASSTDYSSEVAWELVRQATGQAMGVVLGTPDGSSPASPSTGFASFETNRIYQAGLLEAPDVWLWRGWSAGTRRGRSRSRSRESRGR